MKNIAKFILLLCLTISLFNEVSIGQIFCHTDSIAIQQPELFSMDCSMQDNYTPDVDYPNHRQIIYIRVNVHFFQKLDGTGNFTDTGDGFGSSHPTGLDYATNMINAANQKLAFNEPMLCPIGTPVEPPIQFRLILWGNPDIPGDNGVYYHKVTNEYYNYNYNFTNWKNSFSVNGSDVIDIYMVGNATNSIEIGGVVPNIGSGSNQIKLTNAWASYGNGAWTWGWWNFADLLNHEIGHLFGLYHSSNTQCLDVTEPTQQSWDLCNNVMSYNGCQCAWTPCQLGIVHEYLTNYFPNYIAKDSICTFNSSNTITIHSGHNVEWNSSRYLNGDVVVEPSAILTIKCKISLPTEAKIIVKQGGKLIVDGGTLTSTSACNQGLWQGIEVWGYSMFHQYQASSGSYIQGIIELKNGAIIENAHNAVTLSKSGDWQMHHTGGIIWANNAMFRNNIRDVEFMKYQNYNPANFNDKRPNESYFRHCVFETTTDFNSNYSPTNHVTMWNVDGVRFFGCVFENSNTNTTTPSDLGGGILTQDANFIVTGCDWNLFCLPPSVCCSNHTPNIFKNLYYGINAQHVTSNYNYKVDKNVFEGCYTGIANDGVNNAMITRNQFKIGKVMLPFFISAGIAFETGSDFRIEENVFSLSPNPNVVGTVGTWMANTGMNNNQIYKNTFNNLYISNYAYLNNRGFNWSEGVHTGLGYFCNQHNNSQYIDIAIFGTDVNNGGVRQYQGYLHPNTTNFSSAAGNLFTNSGLHLGSDITNESSLNIFYAHNNFPSNAVPIYTTPFKVSKQSISGLAACMSNGGFNLNNSEDESFLTEEIAFYEEQYQHNKQKLLDSSSQHYRYLDSVNTLVFELQNNTQLNQHDFFNTLIDFSPFISVEAMKILIDRFGQESNQLLYQLLISNPDNLRDKNFIDYIESKPFLFSNDEIEFIINHSNNVTKRTAKESQLSHYKSQMDLANNFIIQLTMEKQRFFDMSNDEAPAFRTLLARYGSLHGDYQIVDSYYDSGDFEQGFTLLNELEFLYTLTEYEKKEYNDLKLLLEIVKNINLSDRNIFMLNDDEKEIISKIARTGVGIAQIRACNILSFVYNEVCKTEKKIPLFENNKSAKTTENITNIGHGSNVIVYFPNPAKDYFAIENLKEETNISVYNLQGQIMKEIHLKDSNIIHVGDLPRGVYVLKTTDKQGKIFSGKILLD